MKRAPLNSHETCHLSGRRVRYGEMVKRMSVCDGTGPDASFNSNQLGHSAAEMIIRWPFVESEGVKQGKWQIFFYFLEFVD